MIVNLDNASGAAIEAEAKTKGITTVDYDRLTLGGSAALYVSYDGVAVGEAQGKALTECSQVAGKSAVTYVDVNGAPTDSNAAAFKQGYDSVLSKPAGRRRPTSRSRTGTTRPRAPRSPRCCSARRASRPSWSPTTAWPTRSSAS
jgi:D-xylose transport system substrate-binding protein